MVKELQEFSKDWKSDSGRDLAEGVMGFLYNDIGALEWILKELQEKEKLKLPNLMLQTPNIK